MRLWCYLLLFLWILAFLAYGTYPLLSVGVAIVLGIITLVSLKGEE